jgi:hypothetical protein
MVSIEAIIFYLILIDSIGANVTAWFFANWYKKNVRWWNKHFPATKGWALWYLILVLWIGYGLQRLGMIPNF